MQLVVQSNGSIRCVYDEAIDLAAIGSLTITRASHVEPDNQGRWFADLAPSRGPLIGPFPQRTAALEAEHAWLDQHWLTSRS
jgi:hypothetical protein